MVNSLRSDDEGDKYNMLELGIIYKKIIKNAKAFALNL